MGGVYYETRDAIPRQLLDRVPPVLRSSAIRSVAQIILDRFRDVWPVDTAFSLAQWNASDDGETVYNDASYAEWVWEDPKHGGPPGIAERTWRGILAGDLDSQIREIVQAVASPPERPSTALERFKARRAARGPGLRDLMEQRAGVQTLTRGASSPGGVNMRAVEDALGMVQSPAQSQAVGGQARAVAGRLMTSPSVSLAGAQATSVSVAVGIQSLPVVAPMVLRTRVIGIIGTLYPFAPDAVIRDVQRGDLRSAARRLAQLGRADVARRIIAEA